MGLQSILWKQWLFTEQKSQELHIGYKWLWVYSFVQPNTGENHHYLFGHLNTASFQLTLNEFAKEAKISKETLFFLYWMEQTHIELNREI